MENNAFCTASFETAENIIGSKTTIRETENLVEASTLSLKTEFMIQQPKPKKAIPLSVDDYRKLRKECKAIKAQRVSFADFLFGFSTLLLGGTFSAIISGIKWESIPLSIIFYLVCPIAGVGIAISCIFVKVLRKKDDQSAAERMLNILENIGEGELDE